MASWRSGNAGVCKTPMRRSDSGTGLNMLSEEKLANSIYYLPIDQIDRIQLWLTYKEIKPASTIMLPNPKKDLKKKKVLRVLRWLKRAGIKYSIDSRNMRLLHVSKSRRNVDLLKRIQWREKEEDVAKRGLAYGYPKAAVEGFAIAWNSRAILEKMANEKEVEKMLEGKYWKNYLVYACRKGKVQEDSSTAKMWADEIRKYVPNLAQWYEKR